ncbi:DEAD/DEAH box helicase family protein [Algoriphagus algorifonticola]|uniref:DEAD/DEAH box helicase family protein n=1 Tax=Algoriphagus algorifonticola TaxID=2593007 RepID=UPI0011A8F776|nr:DEAD/DEAH box helicase family protein [Algoriphagus algorifonticola]
MATFTIEIPERIRFLSDYKDGLWDFSKGLPNGILYKKFTGIGATHCEIIAERDSILVFPTIALARSKYLKACKEAKNGFRYQFLNGDVKNEALEQFISERGENDIDKYFVVADSLPRLINFLEEDVYYDYFLMVDEIDTFQVDTSYRSSLEFAVDYFKDFENRCALTATLIPFSDPDFQEENINYFILEKESFEKPEIKLVSVYYPLDTLTYEIIELLKEDEKIVVAINSFDGINNIINNLLKLGKIDEFKTGVLCSQYSKYKIHSKSRWLDVPENGKIQLEHQLTFVTSAYFTGVDFDDEFHLLIGVLIAPQHAMLTFENIYQITGRARNGFLSCKIVKFGTINTSVKFFDRDEIMERVEKVNSLFIHAKEIYSDNEFSDDYASIKSAFGEVKINGEKGFVRENKDGEIVPSSFTIDYKEHFFKSISDYETGANSLLERLQYYFEVQEESDFSDVTKKLEGFTGVDFAENFSEHISQIFDEIYAKILNNQELNIVSGIEQAMLFQFIHNQRQNRRMYSASLQMVFLIEKYGQDYELLKKKFINLNKRPCSIHKCNT